jgi:hypothetical protein
VDLDSNTALVPLNTTVMDTANGIMKKFHAILENAQHLVCTPNGLRGHHALSVVLHLVLMMFIINIVPVSSSQEISIACRLILNRNVAILIPPNVTECAKLLLGVTGVNAVLLTAGASADENVQF